MTVEAATCPVYSDQVNSVYRIICGRNRPFGRPINERRDKDDASTTRHSVEAVRCACITQSRVAPERLEFMSTQYLALARSPRSVLALDPLFDQWIPSLHR